MPEKESDLDRAQKRTPADLKNADDNLANRGTIGERGEDVDALGKSPRGFERPEGGEDWKVEYKPRALVQADRAVLSEEEAFEDVHPYATAETYEAQTTRNPATFPGSALRETAEASHDARMPEPGDANVATRTDRSARPRRNPD